MRSTNFGLIILHKNFQQGIKVIKKWKFPFFYYFYDLIGEISTMNINDYALCGGSERQNH